MAGLSPAQQVLRSTLCFAGGTGANSPGGVGGAVSVASPSTRSSSLLPVFDATPASTSRIWNAGRDSTPPPAPPPTNFGDVGAQQHRLMTSLTRTGSFPMMTSSAAYDFVDDDNDDSFDRRRRYTSNRLGTGSRREQPETGSSRDSGDADTGSCSDATAFEGQLVYSPDGTLNVIEKPLECREGQRNGIVVGASFPPYPPLERISVRRSSGDRHFRLVDRPSPDNRDSFGDQFVVCFVCRKSFANAQTLVGHCRSEHGVDPDEVWQRVEGVSAVLYTVDQTPTLSFLEPTPLSSRSPDVEDRSNPDPAESASDDTPVSVAPESANSSAAKHPLPAASVDDPPIPCRQWNVDRHCDADDDLASSVADQWRRLNGAVVPTTQPNHTGRVYPHL